MDAPNKSVTVSATAAGGNGVAAPSSVTLTITDDEDLPEATLALSPATIDEHDGTNPGSSTVTATLDRASSEAVTLTVSASPGSGTDFTLSSANTLTIAAGSTTSAGTVTITAVNNTTDAPNKSVTVSATAAGGNGVAAPSSVTLTITDDETLPIVTLALSPSSIDEHDGTNPGSSTVTATLDRASSEAVTLTVSASPGSGTDFTLSTANTLTIAAGSTTSAGTVTITAVNDTTDAPDKSVTVSATAAGGNGVAAPSSVTLTITDDEATPTVALVLSPATIDESGTANTVSTVTATLSGASSEAVTVTVSAAPVASTGAMSGDYALSTATTLTIAAGSTTSAGTVTITAVDNSGDEPDIRVTVSGMVAGGNGVTNPDGVTLTIRDDEGPPLATLALSPASISENGGVTTVTATLNRASSAVTTVTVSASGSGFTLSSARTLIIAAGGTTSAGTVTVTAADDATDSPDKSVTVSGSASNTQGVTDPSNVTLTIADDDAAPGVTLALSSSSIDESGASNVSTVSAKLSHPSSAATTVTVTAVTGVYTVGSDATIAIAAGSTTSTDTVTITAVDNDVDADDNAVTVAGTAQNSQGSGTVTGASLTITDDDVAALVLSPSTSTSSRLRTTESGGQASFTVKLATKPTGNVALDVASSDTTEGTVDTDGDTSGDQNTLTFTATDWNTAQTVTLTGVDDSPTLSNPNPSAGNRDYTVTLTVNTTSTLDDNYDALASSPVTVYAVNADNEYGLDVSAAPLLSVTEAGGTATFTVKLVTRPSQAVTVTVTSRDASEGTVSPSTLTFAPGVWNTAWTVTVTGADDAIDDGEVTWDVRLDPSSGDANYNGLDDVDVSVTTTDDDGAPGVTLSLSPASISENGGISTVTATLSHPSSAATTVTVTPVTGFYTVGSDTTIVIAAGETANATDTATVTAVDDAIDNAPNRAGTVTATITNDRATADGTTMTVSGGTLTLTDDDTAGFVFDPAGSLTVTAGGTASTYTVKLSSKPTGAVTVSIASDNDDVTVSPDSLTFTTMGTMSWSTGQPVTVTAAADDDDLADTARLSHAASGGGYNVPPDILWAAVAGGGARIASAGPRTGSVYVVNGHWVTVTEESGVPAGVEIDLPSDLAGAVSVTFKRVGDEVPRESGSFRLEHDGARAMVDVSVMPMPDEGVGLCLAPPAGMREAARRVSGRGVKLLRYTDGSWTAVTNSNSDWDESRSRVCATVTMTSTFGAGNANTRPAFDTTQKNLEFTVDEEIDPPVTLRAAKGGDGTLRYALTPDLPPGVKRSGRRLSGTPTKESGPVTYTWTATDLDGEKKSLRFTIEVKPALEKARARLAAINESILPELSRAMWGSVVDAVTGRLEGSGGGMADTAAAALKAQERTQDEEGLSWRKALEGRTFAVALGAGGGSGDLVAWGGGSRRSLSLDKAALDWSGDLFSAHMGVDGPLGESLRGGLAVSRFEGAIEYTDRSGDAAIAGVHDSRMTAAHPYLGWSGPDGARLWGTLGYGAGEIEITDAEVVARFGVQKGDSAFLAAALGGSVPVLSADGLTLALKGSGEATRYSVDDNGDAIAKVSVGTHRLRLSAEGRRAYALPDGGTLAPSLELGVRWDGGDGETGAGVEAGGGLEWSLPGLTVAAQGRTLAAHEGALKEWGAGGSIRLEPADGRGLSLRLEPRWGAAESGLGRLWDEGVPGRPANGGGEARLEAELGYGLPALGGAGVTTPYAGFGYDGARSYRLGTRMNLGPNLALGIEAERKETAANPEHAVRLELRIRW